MNERHGLSPGTSDFPGMTKSCCISSMVVRPSSQGTVWRDAIFHLGNTRPEGRSWEGFESKTTVPDTAFQGNGPFRIDCTLFPPQLHHVRICCRVGSRSCSDCGSE